jgi:hypothetical protein
MWSLCALHHSGGRQIEDTAIAGLFARLSARSQGVLNTTVFNYAANTALLTEHHHRERNTTPFGDEEHAITLERAGFADDLVSCGLIDTPAELTRGQNGLIKSALRGIVAGGRRLYLPNRK